MPHPGIGSDEVYSAELKAQKEELSKQSPLVQKIYSLIYEYDEEISDGFDYYGGHDSVLELSKKIESLLRPL